MGLVSFDKESEKAGNVFLKMVHPNLKAKVYKSYTF